MQQQLHHAVTDAQLHLPLIVRLAGDEDARIAVHVDDAALWCHLRHVFDAEPASVSGEVEYRIVSGADGRMSFSSPYRRQAFDVEGHEVGDLLVAEVTRIRLLAEPGLHLHAGCVDDAGRGILLVGESGAGKSTMVAHLLASGASLVNDEQVRVDADAQLLSGFRRPLVLDPEGHRIVERLTSARPPHPDSRWLISPTDLAAEWCDDTPPALLVDLRRGVVPATVTPLPAGEMLELLFRHTLDLTSAVEPSLRALASLVSCVPAVSVEYEEAADVVEALRATARRPAVSPEAWTLLDSARSLPARSWRASLRQPVHTLVSASGGILYAAESRAVIRLNRAGATVWQALGERRARRSEKAFVEQLETRGIT